MRFLMQLKMCKNITIRSPLSYLPVDGKKIDLYNQERSLHWFKQAPKQLFNVPQVK